MARGDGWRRPAPRAGTRHRNCGANLCSAGARRSCSLTAEGPRPAAPGPRSAPADQRAGLAAADFAHLGCLRGSETERTVDLGEALSGDDLAAELIHLLPTQRKGFDRGGGRRRPSARRSVRARGWGGSAGIRCGPCREAAHQARYLHHSVGRNPAAKRAASAAGSAAFDSRARPATRFRTGSTSPEIGRCDLGAVSFGDSPLLSYERTRSIRLAAPFCVKTRREARAYVRGGARLWLSVRSA